jgi:hypothetical protein
MKYAIFWDVTPLALVRTDVSEEINASIIRVTRVGVLGTMLRLTFFDFTFYYHVNASRYHTK